MFEEEKVIYLNKEKIIEEYKANNTEYQDKELTLEIYPSSYSIKYKKTLLQVVQAIDKSIFAEEQDIEEELKQEENTTLENNLMQNDAELMQAKQEEDNIKDLEEEIKMLKNQLDKVRENNGTLRLENERLKRELEELKREDQEEKISIELPTEEQKTRKPGRPLRAEKDIDTIRQYIEYGYSMKAICEILDISQRTYFRYKAELKK